LITKEIHSMQSKTTKQAKRRAANARLKLRARAQPIMARGLDLGDVRLQFLLGASVLQQQ